MTKEASKQSKFKHYILAPIRILKKARQLYMKGVVECAGGYGYGAGVGSGSPAVRHISHLPKTKSVNLNSLRTSDDEGQRELLRTVANSRNVRNETRLVMHRQRQPIVGCKYNRMKMSYSIEVRQMGRIDEDQPCNFEEDQIDFKTRLLYLYPRRRSYVVNRPIVYYQ